MNWTKFIVKRQVYWDSFLAGSLTSQEGVSEVTRLRWHRGFLKRSKGWVVMWWLEPHVVSSGPSRWVLGPEVSLKHKHDLALSIVLGGLLKAWAPGQKRRVGTSWPMPSCLCPKTSSLTFRTLPWVVPAYLFSLSSTKDLKDEVSKTNQSAVLGLRIIFLLPSLVFMYIVYFSHLDKEQCLSYFSIATMRNYDQSN